MANPVLFSILFVSALGGWAAGRRKRRRAGGEKPGTENVDADAEEKGEESSSEEVDKAKHTKVFRKKLKNWQDLPGTVKLDAFPTYLSDCTRELLLNSLFIHLQKPEFAAVAKDLANQSNTVLLSGPEGTEFYQERLVNAFARHFKAKLLIISHEDLLHEHEVDRVPRRRLADRSDQVSGAVVQEALDVSLSNSIAKSLISLATLLAAAVAAAALSSGDRHARIGTTSAGATGSSAASSSQGAASSAAGSSSGVAQSLRIGDRVKYISRPSSDPSVKSNQPVSGSTGSIVATYQTMGVRFDQPVPGGNNLSGLCEPGYGHVCYAQDLRPLDAAKTKEDNPMLSALFQVVEEASKAEPLIVLIRHAEELALNSAASTLFQDKLSKLEGPPRLVIVGSHTEPEPLQQGRSSRDSGVEDLPSLDSSEALMALFPTRVNIQPPKDPALLAIWKKQLEKDEESMRAEDNRQVFREALKWTNVECDELELITITDELLADEDAEEVIGWATSYHLRTTAEPVQRDKKLVISAESIEYGLRLLRAVEEDWPTLEVSLKERAQEKAVEQQMAATAKLLKKVSASNKFEERILSEVIPPGKIGVGFDDIGALEGVKKALKELVMLPLRRPELFTKGQLTKPCKGILLFGPPGTGKTMLAKAVATEAGANFINISMSDILSKWLGEAEKNVKAVFTVASKISPTVIFIDEVDSLLGKRGQNYEHETMRKVKNEFMANWDGLRTNAQERVLVLAATNRPFDLDEAIIRRFPRRLMVELPDVANRAKILRVILEKEDLEPGFDFAELAAMTEGYSGSDLKNLCIAAAYQPIRELLDNEEKERVLATVNASATDVTPPEVHTPQEEDVPAKQQESERLVPAVGEGSSEPTGATAGLATVVVEERPAVAAAGEEELESITEQVTSAEEEMTSAVDVQTQQEEAQASGVGKELEEVPSDEGGGTGSAGATGGGLVGVGQEAGGEESGSSRKELDVAAAAAVVALSAPKVTLRPLTMEDMKRAKEQVSASVAGESINSAELRAWNDLYGEGGSRRKETLSYFL